MIHLPRAISCAGLGLLLLLLTLSPAEAQQRAKPAARNEKPFNKRAFERAAVAATEPAREAAVAASLAWLVKHQRRDGSWTFGRREGPSKSRPGDIEDGLNGATGMVLMTLLGAGQTHQDGDYQAQVKAGLVFLARNMKVEAGAPPTLSDGGNAYSHGLATIALCEAYGLTKDKELARPAQAAVNYILYAQDPEGGGWRYKAKQKGDTSVTAWQVQSLYAAKAADLVVPQAALDGAARFLDSVQAKDGAAYGYTSPGNSTACTAAGLYCRTLLGWNVNDNAPLVAGIETIALTGPSPANSYFNYFATQLLRHHEPESWHDWNDKISKQLIASQDQNAAEKGSWFSAEDPWGQVGGRVYCTSLATLVLEAPYRHAAPAK